MVSELPPAILLMGPTASGKTGLAVELVKRLSCDIISVDSAMVYRGMDIGTAKPGVDILEQAPHRLIDILDPAESYSAARFREDALACMAQIADRGRIPLLVGGTMLYFRALERGLSNLPGADPGVRARLEAEAAESGWASLHARLARIDPRSAERIHANDPQRIQRALEVYELSGQPLSVLCDQNLPEKPSYRLIKLIISPGDRVVLHDRIGKRFQKMMSKGFMDEVRALYQRGDLGPEMPSMRAVGYRQAWSCLAGEISRQTMTERAVIATRQYAKRQLTWLRGEENAQWFEYHAGKTCDRITDWLQQQLRNDEMC